MTRRSKPTNLPERTYRNALHPLGQGSHLMLEGTNPPHVITQAWVDALPNNPHKQSSVSAVKNWRACNRLWWFENAKGIKTPRGPEATAGSAMHKQLETRKIEHPSLKIAVDAGLISFPSADGLTLVEEEREFWLPMVHAWVRGFMDQVVLTMDTATGYVSVLQRDYKTKKDDRAMFAYSATPEELDGDFQMNVYAAVLLFEEGVEEVEGEHVYLSRDVKKPGAMTVQAARMYTRDSVQPHLFQLDTDLKVMNQHALLRTIDEVPPNFDHCNAYGKKCPFHTLCHGDLSAWEDFPTEGAQVPLINPPDATALGAQEQTMVDVSALIKKSAVKSTAAGAAPAPATPPAQAAKPTPTPVAKAATPGVAARKVGGNKVTLPNGEEIIVAVKAVGAGFFGVNMDNEQQRANGPTPDAVVNAVALQVLNGLNNTPAEEPLPDDEAVAAAEEPATPPAPAPLPKRGPGRPKKDAAAPAPAPAQEGGQEDAEDARAIRLEVMLTALCKHLGVSI